AGLLAVWRALEPQGPRRRDADGAPACGRAAADQRRDGDRRPDADGNHTLQALFQHRAERGVGPGVDARGVPDADARLADPAGSLPAPVVPGADEPAVGVLGRRWPAGALETDR